MFFEQSVSVSTGNHVSECSTQNACMITQSRAMMLPRDELLIPTDRLYSAIDTAAQQIAEQYLPLQEAFPKPLLLLGVLKSAYIFTAALQLKLQEYGLPTQVDFVQSSSYGLGKQSSGKPKLTWTSQNFAVLQNRSVLVVEDMIDTGVTLNALISALQGIGVSAMEIVVLLEKVKEEPVCLPAVPVTSLFQIPDLWVHGFGIDTENNYRGLSGIWARLQTERDVRLWAEYLQYVSAIAESSHPQN